MQVQLSNVISFGLGVIFCTIAFFIAQSVIDNGSGKHKFSQQSTTHNIKPAEPFTIDEQQIDDSRNTTHAEMQIDFPLNHEEDQIELYSSFLKVFSDEQLSQLGLSTQLVSGYLEEPSRRINNSNLNEPTHLQLAIDTIINQDDSNMREVLLALIAGSDDESKSTAISSLVYSNRSIDQLAAIALIQHIDDQQKRIELFDYALNAQLFSNSRFSESIVALVTLLPEYFMEGLDSQNTAINNSLQRIINTTTDRNARQQLMRAISPKSSLGQELFAEALINASTYDTDTNQSSLSQLHHWLIERSGSFTRGQINELHELARTIASDDSYTIPARIEALELVENINLAAVD